MIKVRNKDKELTEPAAKEKIENKNMKIHAHY